MLEIFYIRAYNIFDHLEIEKNEINIILILI